MRCPLFGKICNFANVYNHRQSYKMFGISKHDMLKKKIKSYILWHFGK